MTLRLLNEGGTVLHEPSTTSSHEVHTQDDEISVQPLTSYLARAEAGELLTLHHCLSTPVTHAHARVCLNQDAALGAHLLTQRNTFFDRADAMELLSQLQHEGSAPALPSFLPPPAILKPRQLWTGKQLVSRTLPPALNFTGYSMNHPDDEQEGEPTPGDTRIHVSSGELLSGSLDGRVLGRAPSKLLHCIMSSCGPTTMVTCCGALSCLGTHYLTAMRGGSFGLGDLTCSRSLQQAIAAAASECEASVTQEVAALREMQLQGRLEVQPGSSSAKSASIAKWRSCSRAADTAATRIWKALPRDNNLRRMANASSAHVTFVTVGKLLAALGPQVTDPMAEIGHGDELFDGCETRRLPHLAPNDTRPEAYGMVTSSFARGLKTPLSFWHHARAGRGSIVSSELRRSEALRVRKQLWRGLTGCHVAYDGTVRDNQRHVIQFSYGDDGSSAAAEERHRLRHLGIHEDRLRKTFYDADASASSGSAGNAAVVSGGGEASGGTSTGQAPQSIIRMPSINWEECRVEALGFSLTGPLVCLICTFLSAEGARTARAVCQSLCGAVAISFPESWHPLALEWRGLLASRRSLCVGRRVPFQTWRADMPLPFNPSQLIAQARTLHPCQGSHDVPAAAEAAREVRELIARLHRSAYSAPNVVVGAVRDALASKRLRLEHHLSRTALHWVVREIEGRVCRALTPPGEMVGSLAAEALGKDHPRFVSLRMFAYAGVSSKHEAAGTPRLQELLSVAPPSTPYLTLFLKPAWRDDSEAAKRVQSGLPHIDVRSVVRRAEVRRCQSNTCFDTAMKLLRSRSIHSLIIPASDTLRPCHRPRACRGGDRADCRERRH